MRTYETVEATWAHILSMRDRLREMDMRECLGQGIPIRKVLHRTFARSLLRRAVISDGVAFAAWGVCGDFVSDEGIPWFLTTHEIEAFPVATLKEARKGIAEMLEIKPYLWNYVLADYASAIKFLTLLGFTIEGPRTVANDIYRLVWIKK